MHMKQFNIAVSMLRQYCFCPRIPHFYLFRSLNPEEKVWMKLGGEEHIRQEMLQKRRNLSRFGIQSNYSTIENNVVLYSENLKLHGVCDAILKTDSDVFILEFKSSENISLNFGAQIQIAAYSMIYEEQIKSTIKRGFILYGNKAKTFEVNIDFELRNKVIKIRDAILEDLNDCVMPYSSAGENKCCQCEFFNFCADRY